ncbi:aldehyde dehydrogenase family protein [Streptomyces sp. NPDC002588]|uniref:aldehyde dehydrogenase family protein n=1 Tax=Streptomyces sp. NPDC002588 TaxID=3154419 RepID=UPI00331AB691
MVTYETIFIDGEWVHPVGTDSVDVVDPATDEISGHVPSCNEQDVDAAVAAAKKAFPAWSRTPVSDRVEFLRRLADLVRKDADELARLVSVEMGAPLDFALSEHVGTPIAMIESFADALASEEDEVRVGNSLIVREPVGVVAAITPWNYPLYQLVAKAVPAVAAGCTVVVKPSELAPLSTFRFTELVEQAGLPAGVYNLVPGRGAVVGDAMSRHEDVDMVSFTGSTRAGQSVAAAASHTIKRVALELGGKSASVVLDGADLGQAVPYSVEYCMANAGQSCSAWTRLIVPRTALAEVEALAVTAAAAVEGTLGPAVSRSQYEQVQEYIRVGLAEGARLIAGGPGNPGGGDEGNFNRVTVFTDVTPDMRIAQEEIFGPVLVIQAYDDVDEAADIANGTPYGLHGGVWAGTDAEALAFARRLRTGQVDVNGGAFNVRAPFGGYKQSGIGRELGGFGLEEFYETKSIQLPE